MQTAAVRAPIVASAQQQKAAPKATVAALPRVAKALGADVASLALALSANAATVKRERVPAERSQDKCSDSGARLMVELLVTGKEEWAAVPICRWPMRAVDSAQMPDQQQAPIHVTDLTAPLLARTRGAIACTHAGSRTGRGRDRVPIIAMGASITSASVHNHTSRYSMHAGQDPWAGRLRCHAGCIAGPAGPDKHGACILCSWPRCRASGRG